MKFKLRHAAGTLWKPLVRVGVFLLLLPPMPSRDRPAAGLPLLVLEAPPERAR